MDKKTPILVLGGSTFMGKQLVHRLCSDPSNIVIYVNRGRRYWNDQLKKKKYQNLVYYYGNRKDKTDFTKLVKYLNKKFMITATRKWAAVVDFCAFEFAQIQSVKQGLQGFLNLYVFISTDSMYDVEFGGQRVERPLPEITQFRELDQQQKLRAKRKQEYGYDKMKCEVFLSKTRDDVNFPYISLRLPDVIGPYDDTGRFWAYLKWFQRSSTNPVEYDEEGETNPMSLVFSEDVATLIARLVMTSSTLPIDIVGQAYHLSFDQNPTLLQFLQLVSNNLGQFAKISKVRNASSFYPSVDFGTLETQKARKKLGWKPTKLEDAIKRTVQFFINQGKNFPEEDTNAEKKLIKKLKL